MAGPAVSKPDDFVAIRRIEDGLWASGSHFADGVYTFEYVRTKAGAMPFDRLDATDIVAHENRKRQTGRLRVAELTEE